ncbi:hypothetical protein, partial [Burkholderia perseverans]|uniref:hypothetical protein n=1 Tax=Burkholderia perseverans TaxID=2615214 RepID=UPI003CC8043C
GTARHGTARHGTARHGTARHGTARHGTARAIAAPSRCGGRCGERNSVTAGADMAAGVPPSKARRCPGNPEPQRPPDSRMTRDAGANPFRAIRFAARQPIRFEMYRQLLPARVGAENFGP